LKVAGATRKLQFTSDAFEEIFLFSNGTPRLINIICDRALLAGFISETFRIDRKIIRKCIEEIN